MGGVVGPALLVGLLQASMPQAYVLQEDMCVPDAAEPEVLFGRYFTNVAVSESDVIHVTSDMSQHALRIAPNGSLIGTIGRAGAGPGEFRQPTELGLVGDSLWVFDRALRRMSLFDSAGNYARLSADQQLLGRFGPRFLPRGMFGDGRVVGANSRHLGRRGGSGPVAVIAVRPGTGGGRPHVDTVANVFEKDRRFAVEIPGGISMVTRSEVDQSSLWMVDPGGDGVIILDQPPAPGVPNGTFVLRKVNGAGVEILRRSFHYDPIRITPAAKEGIARGFAAMLWEGMEGSGVTLPALERALVRSMPLPPEHPPVTDMVGGRDGAVWLKRSLMDADSSRWDVIGPSGVRMGVVLTDSEVTIGWANQARAWGIRRDSLEVPTLCRFRVVGADA